MNKLREIPMPWTQDPENDKHPPSNKLRKNSKASTRTLKKDRKKKTESNILKNTVVTTPTTKVLERKMCTCLPLTMI